MMHKVTHSPGETREFGKTFAERLGPGSVVALTGPLGSGKTVLVQGICSGFQVETAVSSPSFVIINEYPGLKSGARIWVYHFDLYRLSNSSEFVNLGYEEYFYGKGVTLIEWAEKAKEFLPEKRWDVDLKIISDDEREITVKEF